MRILLNWADKGAEMGSLISGLKKPGHEIIYWIGYEGYDEFKAPETIFHSYRDAMAARPAKGVDASDFFPPSADLIRKLYKAESLVLTMLNRFVDKDCVDKRRHLYYHMVRYWHGVLTKYRPDAVILSYIPHFAYDFVIYSLAEFLGVKILTFVDTRIPGRLLPLKNFWKGSEWLHNALEADLGKNFKVEDLAEDIRDYYLPRTDKDFDIIPPNVRFQKTKYSIFYRLPPKIWQSIKDGVIFKKIFLYFLRIWRQRDLSRIERSFVSFFYLFRNNLKKEYKRFQLRPDFSKKFVYVPLQVQPECSTSPQGDIFVDQILTLEILSAALPAGWLIYAKEHPIQWMRWGLNFSSSKYRGYYKNISDVKNVRLLPIETSSYKLINESQAVSTIAGAAGWEALLRSKPAVIFGYPWYYDCPGVLRADDYDSCGQALKKIAGGFKPDQQPIINYLKSFGRSTIRGYMAPSAGEDSGLSKTESVKNIVDFIIKELPKL